MKNFKVTKQHEKELRFIANGLPTLYDRVTVDKFFTGLELKLTGFTVDNKGNKLEDDKTYPVPTPVMNARNHYRRIRKAFEEGGEPSVIEYISRTKQETIALENLSE